MFITLHDGNLVERGSWNCCTMKFYAIIKEHGKLNDFIKIVMNDDMKAAYFDEEGELHTIVVKEATF